MTYLLLDTATSMCRVSVVAPEGALRQYEWQADRQLAKGLLRFLTETLATEGVSWDAVRGIGVHKGPGSFTGLRIGLTVANTVAQARQIPIVGAEGDDWHQQTLGRLRTGDDDQIVLPSYGGAARITQPKK